MKRNWINGLLATVFGLSLFVVLFIGAFRTMLFNEDFFAWHYLEHNVEQKTNTNIYELMGITHAMLEYLRGERDTLDMTAMIGGRTREVFNEREKRHMVDVKRLYSDTVGLQMTALAVGLAALVLIVFKGILPLVLRRLKWIFLWAGAVVITLALLFALDFNRWFILFHKLFFSNDLWLLDPRTDLLINLVPEIYFYQIVAYSSILFLVFILAIAYTSHKLAVRLERKETWQR